MNRIFRAFLLAPLWAPLMAVPYGFIVLEHPLGPKLLLMVGFAAAIAYAGMALLVLPTVLVMRAFQLTGPRTAIVAGFVIGAILWVAFHIVCQRFLWECSLQSILLELESLLSNPNLAVTAAVHGMVGALAGFTFWAIARPGPPPGPWSRQGAA
jgi:hypothetical protein